MTVDLFCVQSDALAAGGSGSGDSMKEEPIDENIKDEEGNVDPTSMSVAAQQRQSFEVRTTGLRL